MIKWLNNYIPIQQVLITTFFTWFTTGAMIYVMAEELKPESQMDNKTDICRGHVVLL